MTRVLEAERLSVGGLLAAIEAGTITAEDALGESHRRIAAGDAALGAFSHRLDAAPAPGSGPLSGCPIGVKDIFDTANMPTEMGSPIFRGHRPPSDATLVAMARREGAGVMGKTVTTPFAFIDPAGTQNPVAPGHTPGGSSSGSAAAVAAGMIAAGFGSQTGGSVIRPASYCGIAGYKPSFRLLPTVGMKTFAWSLDTAGLFAASVSDVALFAARLSGRDLAVTQGADVSGMTVGLYRSPLDDRLEPAMRVALERAAALLEAVGARVVDVEEPAALSEGRDAHASVQGYEAIRALCHEWMHHRARLGPKLTQTLEEGDAITPEAYDIARRAARVARKAATALFESVDVLLAPSALGAPPAGLESTGDPVMNKLWTLTGNPVVGVPGSVTASGLPLGLSIIARFGRDRRALDAAHGLETVLRRET